MSSGERDVATLLRGLEAGCAREVLQAARRLLDLRPPEARLALARCLSGSEPDSLLYEMLAEELPSWGEELVPALLEVLAEVREPRARFGPLEVLSRCGVRDERVYAVLLESLAEDPFEGAMHLSEYGDERAVGPLSAALGVYALADDVADVFAQQTVIELAHTLEQLGGVLDEPAREKFAAARRLREEWNQMFSRWRKRAAPLGRRERPGRNEPCWCGSGVKHKKCHLGEEP